MKVNEVKETYIVLLDGRPFVGVSRECTVACVYDELRSLHGPEHIRVVLDKAEDITARFASAYDEKPVDNCE